LLLKDKTVLEGLRNMIPESCTYTIQMHGNSPVWSDWRWRCEKPVHIYETKDPYELIRHTSDIATCLNKRWGLGDPIVQCLGNKALGKLLIPSNIKFGGGFCFIRVLAVKRKHHKVDITNSACPIVNLNIINLNSYCPT
jgi:hypothetical protein